MRLRRLLRITRRDRLNETVRSILQQERTSNMFQGWEVNGCQHKYKEESTVMETAEKVNGQCTGGHEEENFISNDL